MQIDEVTVDVLKVLASLSTRALATRAIPFEKPKTTFAELLTYWGGAEV